MEGGKCKKTGVRSFPNKMKQLHPQTRKGVSPATVEQLHKKHIHFQTCYHGSNQTEKENTNERPQEG